MAVEWVPAAYAAGAVVTVIGAFVGGLLLERRFWREVVGRKDAEIKALHDELEQERDEAEVAAASRRDMAAEDQARADVLRTRDRDKRLERMLKRLPSRKPAPAAAGGAADAGAGSGAPG